MADKNFDEVLTGNLLYSNPRELNISGNSRLNMYINHNPNNFENNTYSVENIKETSSVPAPSSALLLASGLAGFGYSRKRKNSKKE